MKQGPVIAENEAGWPRKKILFIRLRERDEVYIFIDNNDMDVLPRIPLLIRII